MSIIPIRYLGAGLIVGGAAVAGTAAVVSSIAAQRLDPEVAAIVQASKNEADAKKVQRQREESTLTEQLTAVGKRLGKRVKDDGRCLFYAAGADAEEALNLLQTDATARQAFLDAGGDQDIDGFVKRMRGNGKSYPFAEVEMMPVIAQQLQCKMRVYYNGYSLDFGSGEKTVEVALLGNHYWPVEDA